VNNFFFEIILKFKKIFIFFLSIGLFPLFFKRFIQSLIVISKNLDKIIYCQFEGGFGHTLTTPLYLMSRYNENWLLLFAYNKKRHNIFINKMFPGNIFFVETAILGFNLDLFSRKLFFKSVIFFSKLFYKKIIYNYIEKIYIDHYFNHNKLTNEYYKRYESRIWPEIIKNRYKFNFSHLDIDKKNFLNFFYVKNLKKRVCFFLRYKGKRESFSRETLMKFPKLDIGNILRDSRPIEDYKFIIQNLVEKGFQVFITGDDFDKPDWIKKFGNEVIYYDKFKKLNKNFYNFFCGFSSDIIIGQVSGGSLYSLLNKKNLILETYEVGSGINQSIVSYPYLKIKNLVEFKKIIFDEHFKWNPDLLLNSSKISQLSCEQLNSIYLDYINNYFNEEYGIEPKKVGIDKGWLIDSNSKFSPKWLEIIGI